MSLPNNIKYVFPGSNTPSGFHSFYNNIIRQEKANKIFIIKAGPGTGKSSFMKKVANYFLDKDISIEYHLCSADPSSLDAIVIVPAGVAIIDGTFPHALDCQTPGAIDEIISFAPYWNEKEIRSNKEAIIQTNQKRKKLFAKSYYYLGAAKEVYDAYANTQKNALDKKALCEMEQNILDEVFKGYKTSLSPSLKPPGYSRHLFSSAITPNGFVDKLHTIIGKSKKIYTIKDSPGASADNIMNLIQNRAISLGLDIECYHSPICQSKIEDIIIEDLDTAITVSNHYHKAKIVPTHVYDLKDCLIASILSQSQLDLQIDKDLITMLFNRGIDTLIKAKDQHNILESYYIPHVRFDDMEAIINKVINLTESFL